MTLVKSMSNHDLNIDQNNNYDFCRNQAALQEKNSINNQDFHA